MLRRNMYAHARSENSPCTGDGERNVIPAISKASICAYMYRIRGGNQILSLRREEHCIQTPRAHPLPMKSWSVDAQMLAELQPCSIGQGTTGQGTMGGKEHFGLNHRNKDELNVAETQPKTCAHSPYHFTLFIATQTSTPLAGTHSAPPAVPYPRPHPCT